MAKKPTLNSITEALKGIGPTAFGSSADYAAFQAALEGEDVDEARDADLGSTQGGPGVPSGGQDQADEARDADLGSTQGGPGVPSGGQDQADQARDADLGSTQGGPGVPSGGQDQADEARADAADAQSSKGSKK